MEMKRWLKTADSYIKQMSVRDMVMVKICVAAWGILFGAGLAEKHRKVASIGAAVVFAITYPLVMIPFLNMLEKTKKEME